MGSPIGSPIGMLSEFYLSKSVRVRVWAWSGLLLIIAHAFLRAYVKRLFNDWMGRFYDLGGKASTVGDGQDVEALRHGSQKVTRLLTEFAVLCIPSVLVHPLVRLLINRWVLAWRITLIESYLESWATESVNIENAAQRVHEDTGRFAKGLQTCVMVLLDSILTVGVFAPVLLELGSDVQPIELPESWILMLCVAVAICGLLVSMGLGWSLIALEVNNQRVEADLRKQLVLHEERVVVTDSCEPRVVRSLEQKVLGETTRATFAQIIGNLKSNYVSLYNKFAIFSVWLGTYEQAIVILPYVLTGPMLFSSSHAISLGTVTKVSHSFATVFDALNILSDRWVDVTDFLSVVRRLREFERGVAAFRARSSVNQRVSLINTVEMASIQPDMDTA